MAATKHPLPDNEDVVVDDRPTKKSKNDAGGDDAEKARLKKERREKKQKKEEKEEGEKKNRKVKKEKKFKKDKQDKKEQEEKKTAEEDVEMTNTELPAEKIEEAEEKKDENEKDKDNQVKDKKKKKKKKDNKDKKDKKEKKKQKKEAETIETGKEAEENKAEKEDRPVAASVEEDKPKKDGKKEKKQKEGKSSSANEVSRTQHYVQTMSLNNVGQAEIDRYMSENQIIITDPRDSEGKLRPVTEFHHLPSTNLLEKKPSPFAGFKTPTPIQAASWPSTLSGRDVIGVAETGSGKTMAFALPLVEAICGMGIEGGVKAVVVSPTRELAMQTHEQLARLAALAKLKCVCLYGGSSKDDQRAQLRKGCDVIVATPGRLKDFMSDETVGLGECRFAVLDEADRMLDKGFEEDIRLILGACRPRGERQTLMFTATWPFSVQNLASTFMVDPVKITIGSGGKETENGSVELQANARITQRVEVVEPRDKEGRLLQIIKQHQQGKQRDDRILVFCLYKKEATRVEGFLSRKGVRVAGIHGDLKQEQRTRSLEAFKSGQTPVLVATDVAARGLDIPEVKLVVNVTFPLTIEDYVHRIGRTGRAGKTGEAITLFTTQDKAHSGSLVNILKGANQPVPDELLKFGTAVKKKTHDMYGAFFKDVDPNQKATKITFD